MSPLFEECRCLGAHQHCTLVLSNQRSERLRFSLCQPLALMLQVEFFKLLRSSR